MQICNIMVYTRLHLSKLMDSSSFTFFLPFSMELPGQRNNGVSFVDRSIRQKQTNIPTQFTWPKEDLVDSYGELMEPVVDLEGFFRGDEVPTQQAAMIIRDACLNHGFFQVINHGVDSSLIHAAHAHIDNFFTLPMSQKLKARRMPGKMWGYSGAHADRFCSKLPWKETLSFGFDGHSLDPMVLNFFKSNVGKDFEKTGMIFQTYSEAMKGLSLAIMELLAISLGINDRLHYRKFFEDGCSIMRCNSYPPSQKPGLVLGTGPHCDPTSLTILHQDQVGGLEVFANNRWMSVRPRHDALVINIGETFMALSNGKYKSCLHRAVANRDKERRSLVFFLCPRDDIVVRPPQDLICSQGTRTYPDFTWSELLEFTQKHYRPDTATLENFTKWLLSSKPSLKI